MDHHAAPETVDPRVLLTRDVYYELVHSLHRSLPEPLAGTPEDQARRDRAAIAHAASMVPANAEEAHIAARSVAADAYAMDCLRQSQEAGDDQMAAQKCLAQAISMMREARQARSLLLRVQAARRKQQSDNAATDAAAWSEHCTIGLMTDALTGAQDAPAPVAEPEAPPVAAAPQEETRAVFETATEAEQYAIIYPRRAALIRRHGGLPPGCDFGPPEPALVQAIATGNTPTLRALDTGA